MLNYFISLKDDNGYIHSVDNLVVTYSINPVFQNTYLDMIVDCLHNLRDKHKHNINYWERLNVNVSERLTSRANKRLSKKTFLPLEYFSDTNNVQSIENLVDFILPHILYIQ